MQAGDEEPGIDRAGDARVHGHGGHNRGAGDVGDVAAREAAPRLGDEDDPVGP